MLSDMFLSRSRTALSGYEKVRLAFHVVRLAQLASGVIVGCIMSFFIYHLTHDNWPTPWTFKVLLAVSILTIAILCLTITLHLRSGLNPRVNLVLNGTIFAIWTAGFGMLSWWMWGTLTHYCDTTHWSDGTGIMVCRIYKALFSFSLLGVVSTLLALLLDIHILRKNRLHQHFRLGLRSDVKNRSPYTNIDHSSSRVNLARDSEAFEIPGTGYGAEGKRHEGYAVPEAQFDYETGYYGGHAERVFGAK